MSFKLLFQKLELVEVILPQPSMTVIISKELYETKLTKFHLSDHSHL